MREDLPTPAQVYAQVAGMLARAAATPVAGDRGGDVDDDGDVCPCMAMSWAAMVAAASAGADEAERGPIYATLTDGKSFE